MSRRTDASTRCAKSRRNRSSPDRGPPADEAVCKRPLSGHAAAASMRNAERDTAGGLYSTETTVRRLLLPASAARLVAAVEPCRLSVLLCSAGNRETIGR